MTDQMAVSCPCCGSKNVSRLPGLAENGWRSMKGGFIMIAVYFILPASLVMKYMNVILLIMLGMFGIGLLCWSLWILRLLFAGPSTEWSWECQACKSEFSTASSNK